MFKNSLKTTKEPLFDNSIAARFIASRKATKDIAAPLKIEDQVVQAMADTSPTKWHLAHVTWFYENFILIPHCPGYRVFNSDFAFLFNSYYEAAGMRHPRPDRGLITRPSVDQVLDYREYVENSMEDLLSKVTGKDPVMSLTELGINHEQQHQELMLMDILNLFSRNPLRPAYTSNLSTDFEVVAKNLAWSDFEGGLYEIGHDGNGFAFDNEGPRHKVFLRSFNLSNHLVTNGEWLDFMNDEGYKRHDLWLSDGIARVRSEGWDAPLYWYEDEDLGWCNMTLIGPHPINSQAPVSNLSFYEADAYARWAKCRLPTEVEWEAAAKGIKPVGNFLEQGHFRPVSTNLPGLNQMFGDLWEWTASPYVGYPGYVSPEGAVGEYNGKFMSGQMTLRGGSCITPEKHIRTTYRNFFYPHQRWAFTGLRLAKDAN